MSNELTPRTASQEVMLPDEVVKNAIITYASQHPDIIGYDPSTDQGELIHLRVMTDSGVPASQRDGFSGTVVSWGISAMECADPGTGEIAIKESLALIMNDGKLLRLFGWPAIRSWSKLVQAAGKDRCQIGLPIVAKKRPSNTAGKAYWVIVPDA